MNKKGASLDQAFVGIIIFGIVMIVIILVSKEIFIISRTQVDEKACQTSLLLSKLPDLSPICSIQVDVPSPLQCPRTHLVIDDAVIIKNGKEVTQLYAANCPDNTQNCLAKNALAEEMRSCWSLFFKGEQVLFQKLEIDELGISRDTNARVCYVCSEMQLSTDIKDFKEYVEKTTMPRQLKEQEKKLTYYQYLSNRKALCDQKLLTPESPTCWEAIAQNINGQNGGRISTFFGQRVYKQIEQNNFENGAYAIIFMRRGMGTCENEKLSDGDDPYAVTNTVQVIPATEIAMHCPTVIV